MREVGTSLWTLVGYSFRQGGPRYLKREFDVCCIQILAYLVSWRALGRPDFSKCVASRRWASWQVAIQPYFLDVDVLALSGER